MESKSQKMRKIGLRVVLLVAISILLLYSVSRQWRESTAIKAEEEEAFEIGEYEGRIDNPIDVETVLEDWNEKPDMEIEDVESVEANNDLKDFTPTTSSIDDYAETTVSAVEDSVDVKRSHIEDVNSFYDENNDNDDVVLDNPETNSVEVADENDDDDDSSDEDLISWLRSYFYDDDAGTEVGTTTSFGKSTVNLAVSDDYGAARDDNEIEKEIEQGDDAAVTQPTDETVDESDTFAERKFAAFSFFAQSNQTTTPGELDSDNNSEYDNNDEFQEEEVGDENEGYLTQSHADISQSYQTDSQVTEPSSSEATTQTTSSHSYGGSTNHPYAGIIDNDKEKVNSSSDQHGNNNVLATNQTVDAATAGREEETAEESVTKSSTEESSFLLSLQKLSAVNDEAGNDTQISSSISFRERMVLLLKSLNLANSEEDPTDDNVNDTSHSDTVSAYSASDLTQSKEFTNELSDSSTATESFIGSSHSENGTTTTTTTTTTVKADVHFSELTSSSTPSTENPITVTETSMPNTLVSPIDENESEISQETEVEKVDGSANTGRLEERDLQTTLATTTMLGETFIPDDLSLSTQESLSSTASSTERPSSVTHNTAEVNFDVKEFLGQLDVLLKNQKLETEEASTKSHDNITVNINKRETREEDASYYVGYKDEEQETEEEDQRDNGIDVDNDEELRLSASFPSVSQDSAYRATPSNNGEFQDLYVGLDSTSEGENYEEETTVSTEYATGSYVPVTTSKNGLAYDNPRPLSDNDLKTLRTPSYGDRSEPVTRVVHTEGRNTGDYVKTNDYSIGIEANSDTRNSDNRGNVKLMSSCLPPTALSESTHAVTALVSFPGAVTDWMRRTLEQLANEPSDSIYRVIARVDEGDITPLLEMNRRVVIETHSNVTQRFNRGILLLTNPLAVEQKHLHFRPFSTEWRSSFLWSRHVVSWLETDIPVLVITYEDMVENIEGYLSMIANFLNITPTSQNLACALEETPPSLIHDISRISGLYSQDRRLIATAIDKVIKTAANTYPHILRRLYMYRSSTGVP